MDSISNKNKLKSFTEYSLAEIFSTNDRKIIIPDFQRDYCWGDKTHGENNNTDIVSGFFATLWEEFESKSQRSVTLGKIDVYENPTNHIYLTDGQQRLTTLYLLIGILYRKTRLDSLRNCLISKYEEAHDDKEPYLQYAIRESTTFFLRDLVNEFFISNIDTLIPVTKIKEQFWYFREYDNDPSIQSMILALETIENEIKKSEIDELNNFSNFLVSQVEILYNDVSDRSNGEERFVIINTTGRSLTVSENLKPILLASGIEYKYCEEWEERETFFWKNRKENEQVADDGVNDFLTWCFQIIEKHERTDLIKDAKNLSKENVNLLPFLDKIHALFDTLKSLEIFLKEEKLQQQLQFVNKGEVVQGIIGIRSLSSERKVNVLLPILAYLSKFRDVSFGEFYSFLRRLRKNYFDCIWEERKFNYIDWRFVLQIIERSEKAEDCLTFKNSFLSEKNVKLPDSYWFNEEEKLKTELTQFKEKLQIWEDHPDFMGDLSQLMEVTEKSKDISQWELYFNTYIHIVESNDSEIKNEVALITYCSKVDFFNRWFTVSGLGYICLEKKERNRIFRNKWFKLLWNILAENENNRIGILKSINRNILSLILSNSEYKYSDEYWERIFKKDEVIPDISKEMIDDFEKNRVENWWYGDDYAIATIYYWMFLEKEYDNNQFIGIKNGYNQVGFRRIEKNTENENNLSFANISIGTHYSSGKYLNYNYSLMNAIYKIKNNADNSTEHLNDLLNVAKIKIANH